MNNRTGMSPTAPVTHVLAERYGPQLARRILEAAARDAGVAGSRPAPLEDARPLQASA